MTSPVMNRVKHDPIIRYIRLKVAYVKLVYKNSSWADSAHQPTPRECHIPNQKHYDKLFNICVFLNY